MLPLRVSENRRFLVHSDGQPFFWLGDTAWELFHRLNRAEADLYLENRAAKGFTVIQAVALGELDGIDSPNPYGDRPLVDQDPTRPNEPYWQQVDYIVRRANALGLVIGFLPTWGGYWKNARAAGGIFTAANAEAYGAWLGRRYRDAGVVWILGGDRPVETDCEREIIRAMAAGLRGNSPHLCTFHTNGDNGSSRYFHDEPWLDFNMRQNGHVTAYADRYENTRRDYERTPVKPVLDGEPVYEDIPIDFNAERFGFANADDVRRPLYWELFDGAFGHTYGHNSVWQMWTPEHKPVLNPLMPWQQALDRPGAGQMQHARWLLESRPFLTRIPAPMLVVSTPEYLAATRDTDGTFAMVYTAFGSPCRVRLDCLAGSKLNAWWFNPRNGESTRIGEFANSREREFVPPAPGDWVLVLDDAARNYPAPGRCQAGRLCNPPRARGGAARFGSDRLRAKQRGAEETPVSLCAHPC